MHLSIVIPAWNEAGKIADDIREISDFVKNITYSVELIIVDDGSEDNTSQIVEEVSVPESLNKQLIQYTPHRGKGYAVRKGISESSGDNVIIMDSGRNVPVKTIESGLKLLKQNKYDVLNGSRYLPDSVIRKKLVWYRVVTSKVFRKYVKWYLKLPDYITDTQCGFKLFNGAIARELIEHCSSDGFVFDLEILLLALKKQFRVCELPIEWTCDRDSRLSLVSSISPIFRELRRLKSLL